MRVGVLGAGQLARMLASAAKPLDLSLLCFDPTEGEESPASFVAEVMRAPFADENALSTFAKSCDVITVETENIPLSTIDFLGAIKPLYPPREAIATTQDRLLEKKLCLELGIEVAPFSHADTRESLCKAIEAILPPVVVKTRRFGYDGKGQCVVTDKSEIEKAEPLLQGDGCIIEKLIPFDYELSMIAVRGIDGEIVYYPLVRNFHHEGILRYSIAPWNSPALFSEAKEVAEKILTHFSYVGVLAVEFFVSEGKLLLNEMAPRVHNSGHWSIEGAACSQFENHLRAITGMPLGSTTVAGCHVMFNNIGDQPDVGRIEKLQRARYHDYQKRPRRNRKIGHVTLSANRGEELLHDVKQLETLYPSYSVPASGLLPICDLAGSE